MDSYTFRLVDMAGVLQGEDQTRSTSAVDPADLEPLEPLAELRTFRGALEGWSRWYIDYETMVPGDAAQFSLYLGSDAEEHLVCTVGLFAREPNAEILEFLEWNANSARSVADDFGIPVTEPLQLNPSAFPSMLQMNYVVELPDECIQEATRIAEQVACAFWLTVDEDTTQFD